MRFWGRIKEPRNPANKKFQIFIINAIIKDIELKIQSRLDFVKILLKDTKTNNIVSSYALANIELKRCRIDMELYNILLDSLEKLK